MSIQLSPKQCNKKISKAEVKRMMSYDRSEERQLDELLSSVDFSYEEYERMVELHHKGCSLIVNANSVDKCKRIISFLTHMGGEPAYSIESNLETFSLRIGAYFAKRVSFAENMDLICDVADSLQFSLHTAYSDNNEVLISCIVDIGKYVENE